MSIKAYVSVAHKLGFTSHQNAVPLLRELVLHNESDQAYQDLTLYLQTTPAVLEAKLWKIDRLLPRSSLDIRDRDVKLNAEWLAELTESVLCEVTLCLRQGEDELFTVNYPLEALAKNEWGGDAMVELLPSFIMPNDPAIDRLLKATADVLHSAGKRESLDGYESKSRTRVGSWLPLSGPPFATRISAMLCLLPALNATVRRSAHPAPLWKPESQPVSTRHFCLLLL